jgi:hypothetical protein
VKEAIRLRAGAVVMLLAGVGMLGGGIFELGVFFQGTEGQARVTGFRELVGRVHTVACTGTWATGALVGGKGHVVTGLVDGATEDDVGQTLSVRLYGGRAYVPILRIPLILIAFGVAFLGYGVHLLRMGKKAGALRAGR